MRKVISVKPRRLRRNPTMFRMLWTVVLRETSSICTRVSSKEDWSVPSQAASSPSLLGQGEHELGSWSTLQ